MLADDDAQVPHLKFGTGQSVSRKEDPKLVTGCGRFTDDVIEDDLPVLTQQFNGVLVQAAEAFGAGHRVQDQAVSQW